MGALWRNAQSILARHRPEALPPPPLEYRGLETAFLACFAALLKSEGVDILLDDLLSIAPIRKGEISRRKIHHCARRIGIDLEEIDHFSIGKIASRWPILIQRQSMYAFLIWRCEGAHFQVSLPGFSTRYTDIDIDADVLQNVEAAYYVKIARPGLLSIRRTSPQRLWLLPWRAEYQAVYDPAPVQRLRRKLARTGRQTEPPARLNGLAIHDVLHAHRSMCPALPEQYGTLRTINLRRDSIFVDHRSVGSTLRALLEIAASRVLRPQPDPFMFAAHLLSDFLSIHPFINGNRRMAMLVVDFYVSKLNMSISWDDISISEMYYWCRLASRGHCGPLIAGMKDRSFTLNRLSNGINQK